ncbi:MAG TPA: acyl-CoA dehydrogenase family protein [Dehalococcoidia bacterium]|jgi:(2S)-methylsuccinyl-CoA dehydrogenase|nr:acyl-CoA dehydrogenase family protein [Dehalococcoidia bacterium]
MTTEKTESESLTAARHLADIAAGVAESAIESAAKLTDGGKNIDEHQVHAERIAQIATEARAAGELTAYAEAQAKAGKRDALAEDQALAFAAEALHKAHATIETDPETFAIDQGFHDLLAGNNTRNLIRAGMSDAFVRGIGGRVLEARGAFTAALDDEIANMTRDHARDFARTEVAPIAQDMHRQDLLVPESLIQKMAGIGLFGSSIPEAYGGTEMGYLTMVVLTEELSTVSLVAGSLITRSEILTRALIQGGTEEQRKTWLPRIASGELLVGIGVTEPDVGSDVASLSCKATPGEHGGKKGWFIEGPKAWSTFAGRANILALLARTGEAGSGAKGLSLFIVPKEPYDGHHFEHRQPEGGTITGTANPTPGYRGMHSFTLAIDHYFVPEENLVGGADGLNRGFYLQMGGFAAGRLQTGGRATGVSQASVEKASNYASDRKQFGKPLADHQLTQYKIGRMATYTAAGRHLTYAAAKAMEKDERASMEAAMCKLFASDVAVWVSQEGMLIHGGWGYSEEDPISRFTVDALVLPIFEGVKPILELKVIARQLLAGG